MGIVRELLSATARHRRRGLKEETLRKGDMFFAAWLTAAVFIRFAVNVSFAMGEIGSGKWEAGLAIAEFNSLHFLVVTFLLTFLVSSLFLGSMGLDRRRLGSSPVGFPKLFLAELIGLFFNPMGAVVLPFAVPAVLELLILPHPPAAVATLLACFLAVYLMAWTLSTALSLRPSINRSAGFLRIAFTAVMLGLLLANFDFQWKDGGVKLFLFQHPILLAGAGGGGFLPSLRPWSPSAWIMGAAQDPMSAPWPLFAAAAAVAALGLSALASHGANAMAPRQREAGRASRRRRGLLGRGGLFRVLFSNEISYLLGSMGIRLSWCAAAACSLWLLAAREPTVNIAILGAFLVLAAGFPYPSNLFGHDGAAVRRYALASLDWGTLFLAKNIAYVAVTAAPLALVCLAAAIRASAAEGLSLALTSAVLLALSVLWGNLSSILVPSASGRRDGVFANQLFPIAVWAVPFLVNRSVAGFATASYRFVMLGCLLLSCIMYALLWRRISLRFDFEVEKLIGRL